ncbi:type IX secretion system membrane protein PorP/SprF [Chryseolinea sp. H1M3-3]|uniref:PorP/SprF family type IX secretion system membrane protein n=1 Tax=Chryseolinea sp. H1M3-3 TaxID=3034144 RepID=UPI0023EBEAF5|nr:type IX secretion system membrane protein PorP/SprF [Chryseolinea sp. H1M3-3]
MKKTLHINVKKMDSVKKMWRLHLVLVIILISLEGNAQQNPLFTQYMFNGLVINPAYTGSHESMTATLAARSQWTGLKGAPQTQVASLHSPLKFSRSAAGAVFVHDKVSVINQYMFYGTYAYRIPVSKNAKIAIGGQAGATYYQANLSELNIITQNGQVDPTFAQNESRVLPNLGIGAYFYSKRSYIGISLPTLINNRWNDQDTYTQARQKRHYFLSAGHVFALGPQVKLKPNVLLKWQEGGAFQYDLNANMLFHEVLWVGVSYRMKDSVDGLLEMNINNQLSLGYSYGYPISSISSIQTGTHEVVLNYRISRNKHIVYSPRYF